MTEKDFIVIEDILSDHKEELIEKRCKYLKIKLENVWQYIDWTRAKINMWYNPEYRLSKKWKSISFVEWNRLTTLIKIEKYLDNLI